MRSAASIAWTAAGLLLASVTRADFYDSDDEVIAHIRATDYVFSRVLAGCRNERLVRDRRDGSDWFTYSAVCQAPPPEDDCGTYTVSAEGTVDRADVATVRDLRMVLQCTH